MPGHAQRGAALVTVLLFVALVFILITSMLAVMGNEIGIAGLQRDGVLALDLAQAGLQEAIRRMEEGRPHARGFTGSFNPSVAVTVTRRTLGTNSAYQEIQSTAVTGRATRKISMLVLQKILFPPNVLFVEGVQHPAGPSSISNGDIYSPSYVYMENAIPNNNCSPATPETVATCIWSGWRISLCLDGECPNPPSCYRAPCAGQTTWYPGTRISERETTALGRDIVAQTNKCPEGGGGVLSSETITGVFADDVPPATVETRPLYGFDTDDPDGAGPIEPLAVSTALPCGLPYKYVAKAFRTEPKAIDGFPERFTITRIFKVVAFEQWFRQYWTFDEARMRYVRTAGLSMYPQFGAVPPFPDITTDPQNYDRALTGGGPIVGDLGCRHAPPVMSCAPTVDRPVSVWADSGNWTISSGTKGHGTLVIEGNLKILQPFEWWGTVIVKGQLTVTSGPVRMHGGMMASEIAIAQGHVEIQIEAGGNITAMPVGRSEVTSRGWWER